MQLDGKTEESDKTKRHRLTTAINRYEKLLSLTDAQEDPVLFKSLQDHIAEAKNSIIALNPPEEQLKNLQGAIQRKQKIAMSLTSSISDLQKQLLVVQEEVASLQLMEKKLQDQLSYVRVVVDTSDSDRLLQLQLQHSQLQSQFQSERERMVDLLQKLQAIPGLPESALTLLPPGLGVPAPSTPNANQRQQEEDIAQQPKKDASPPREVPVTSPTQVDEEFPTGFEPLNQDFMQESYGPSTASHSRPSPYGAASAGTETQTPVQEDTQVFREEQSQPGET